MFYARRQNHGKASVLILVHLVLTGLKVLGNKQSRRHSFTSRLNKAFHVFEVGYLELNLPERIKMPTWMSKLPQVNVYRQLDTYIVLNPFGSSLKFRLARGAVDSLAERPSDSVAVSSKT